MENTIPHIGTMLKSHLDNRRARKSVLARKMEVSDTSILNYQKRESLQLSILWKLSQELKHNFFADIAALLPADFTKTTPADTSKDDEIARLKHDIEILEAKKNVLLDAMKGMK